MIDLDKEFEKYYIDLIVKAIKANDMELRDKIVREKEDVKWAWHMQRRITVRRYDNEKK